MHPNAALLHKLFEALRKRNPAEMASCYRDNAHFHDIAFDLQGRERIADMWRFICSHKVDVEIVDIEADDYTGRARVVEQYEFGHRHNDVTNKIESNFTFKDWKIATQTDECDAKVWARQALRPFGFVAGRSRFVRSLTARLKLRWFLLTHPA